MNIQKNRPCLNEAKTLKCLGPERLSIEREECTEEKKNMDYSGHNKRLNIEMKVILKGKYERKNQLRTTIHEGR